MCISTNTDIDLTFGSPSLSLLSVLFFLSIAKTYINRLNIGTWHNVTESMRLCPVQCGSVGWSVVW